MHLDNTTRQEVSRIARRIIERETEDKHWYNNSSTSALSFYANGTLIPLSQVPQGNSDATRVGDQIKAKHLRVSLRLVGQGSNTATVMRAIIFRWKPLATSTSPLPQTIMYETMAQDYQSVLSSFDPKVVPSQAIVISDFTCYVDQPYEVGTGFKVFDLPLNFEQVYTGDTYCTNSLHLLLIAQGSASASSYVYNSCFTYKDA